jgi:hypothetical protein
MKPPKILQPNTIEKVDYDYWFNKEILNMPSNENVQQVSDEEIFNLIQQEQSEQGRLSDLLQALS